MTHLFEETATRLIVKVSVNECRFATREDSFQRHWRSCLFLLLDLLSEKGNAMKAREERRGQQRGKFENETLHHEDDLYVINHSYLDRCCYNFPSIERWLRFLPLENCSRNRDREREECRSPSEEKTFDSFIT